MQTEDYIEINSPDMKILTEQALRDILKVKVKSP